VRQSLNRTVPTHGGQASLGSKGPGAHRIPAFSWRYAPAEVRRHALDERIVRRRRHARTYGDAAPASPLQDNGSACQHEVHEYLVHSVEPLGWLRTELNDQALRASPQQVAVSCRENPSQEFTVGRALVTNLTHGGSLTNTGRFAQGVPRRGVRRGARYCWALTCFRSFPPRRGKSVSIVESVSQLVTEYSGRPRGGGPSTRIAPLARNRERPFTLQRSAALTYRDIISLLAGSPQARAENSGPLHIIAHHGSVLELPENTIQSCERALALGANALEIDLCMTRDEELILWHDWDPGAFISGTRQVELAHAKNAFKSEMPSLGSDWRKPTLELSLEEFRAHYTFRDDRDAALKRQWEIEQGPVDLTVPTLPEFFSAAKQWPRLRAVYLDVKVPPSDALRCAGPMTDRIHELNVEQAGRFDVIVMVCDCEVLRAMKARSDEKGYSLVFTWDVEFPAGIILAPRKYSAIDHATNPLFHNAAASVGRPVAALFPWRVYRSTIEYDIRRWNAVNANASAENAGVQIRSLVAWTINDKREMECLTRMGVSGIITDNIADLAAVAAANGR
jgi:glycerophosphoryl diester phosphodiesterase